jgi:hypothetical protein
MVFVVGAATPGGPAGLEDGDGVLYQSTDFGATWSGNIATYQPGGPFPRHNPFNAVAFDGAVSGFLYVGLDAGGLYWTSNSFSTPPVFTEGNTDSPLSPGDTPLIATQIREIAAQPSLPAGVSTGKVFAGGDSRTVWFRSPGPTPPAGVWVARDVPILATGGWGWHAITSVGLDVWTNRVYVGDRFRIQFGTDDGMTWNPIGPTFPGEVTEIAVAPQIASGQIFSTLLVATTVGVHRSVDGGATFFAATGPANVVNFTFHRNYSPGSDHTVFAAVEGPGGGFFRSLHPSDGATWSGSLNSGLPASNPGLTIIAHDGANTLYAGSGGGNLAGVYRSTNLGMTWTLPSTLTGLMRDVFGLAVRTEGATNAVYASTRGGVVRSVNQGANWTGYNQDLINTRCGPLRLTPVGGPVRLILGTEGAGVWISS